MYNPLMEDQIIGNNPHSTTVHTWSQIFAPFLKEDTSNSSIRVRSTGFCCDSLHSALLKPDL